MIHIKGRFAGVKTDKGMTNYENDIVNLLPGETPKQKYEYLQGLLQPKTHKDMTQDQAQLLESFYKECTNQDSDSLQIGDNISLKMSPSEQFTWFLANAHRLQPKADTVSDEEIRTLSRQSAIEYDGKDVIPLKVHYIVGYEEGFKEAMSRLQPKSDAIEFGDYLKSVVYFHSSVSMKEFYQLFLAEKQGREGK